jgi:hypothetical protein
MTRIKYSHLGPWVVIVEVKLHVIGKVNEIDEIRSSQILRARDLEPFTSAVVLTRLPFVDDWILLWFESLGTCT